VIDVRGINFLHLKNQERIRAMAFDKDNCLTAPYVPSIHPPFEKAWVECKDAFGRDNIRSLVEKKTGVPVLRHAEKKPSGGADLAAHLKGIPAHQVAMVGDRLLTDIVFGNLNGNYTIWTRHIVTEEGDNKAALVVIFLIDMGRGWQERLQNG
ncbi:HAD superfamily phosphatase, partial [Dichotomocladium elegans]